MPPRQDLPLAGASPCWDVALNTRGLLDPGVLYLGYAEHGGRWIFLDADGRVPGKYWLVDPRTGEVRKSGERPPDRVSIEVDGRRFRLTHLRRRSPHEVG